MNEHQFKVCSKCTAHPFPVDFIAHVRGDRLRSCPTFDDAHYLVDPNWHQLLFERWKGGDPPYIALWEWADRVRECPHFQSSQE